jgi:hypothetical protein
MESGDHFKNGASPKSHMSSNNNVMSEKGADGKQIFGRKTVITMIMAITICAGIFTTCTKESVNLNKDEQTGVKYSKLSNTVFYDAMIGAQNDVLSHYSATGTNGVSKNDFITFFVDAYNTHKTMYKSQDFSTYRPLDPDEFTYFESAIQCLNQSTYALRKKAISQLLMDISTYPISKETKERLDALAQILNATCDLNMTALVGKYQKESEFETRLVREIDRLLKEIFSHPIKTIAFMVDLPTSWVYVVAEATYNVITNQDKK